MEKNLTKEEMDLVTDVYRVLAQHPKFKKREQQRKLIGFASNLFADGAIGVAEAPTGVGKTVSYLIPGIVASIVRKKRLIVSTATVALQNQIIDKDIQFVTQAFQSLGYSIQSSLVKGRERYICKVKLNNETSQHDMFSENEEAELVSYLQKEISNPEFDGELTSSKKIIPIQLANKIKSDRHSCTGERCHEYEFCGYYKKVNEAKEANVVVVNHSLLLSAIMHVPNSIYSEFENNLYVFDEGHHIPEKSNSIFSSVIPNDMTWLSVKLKELMTSAKAPVPVRVDCTLQSTIVSERLKSASKIMSTYGRGKVFYRFSYGVIPDDILVVLGEAYTALKGLLEKHVSFLDGSEKLTKIEKVELSALKGILDETLRSLENFMSVDEDNPIAKWAEFNAKEWMFKSSPFDAGYILNNKIWKNALEKKSGVLIASATIATLGDFRHFMYEAGLHQETTRTLLLNTPFGSAYSKVNMLVPRMKNMPENVVEHTNEVKWYVEQELKKNEGGILVLFASNKQMKDVYEALPENVKECILMQGQYGFSEIIERHTEKINQNKPSMIFGLSTFSEGVDLPGKLCTNVIITKIPFPSPDEPLVAAACEWVNKKNENKAFGVVMIPKAVIRFKQSIGRLIRSDDDYGRIVVLDRRLIEKSYGKQLMNNVPLVAKYGY